MAASMPSGCTRSRISCAMARSTRRPQMRCSFRRYQTRLCRDRRNVAIVRCRCRRLAFSSRSVRTDKKTREQGFALANRAAKHIAFPVGVVSHQPLIPFILVPTYISFVVSLNQNVPIVPVAASAIYDVFSPICDLHKPTASSECVCASINWIGQDVIYRPVLGRPPLD